MTFDSDVTFPLLNDVKAQRPDAVCEARATNVSSNILINRDAPPFNSPELRHALMLAIDNKAFNDILAQGHDLDGAAMLPPPQGVRCMPKEMLAAPPTHAPDNHNSPSQARTNMEYTGG